ncbi:MAG: protein-glutamate O-methyltransferase CheR [Geobacteraceae bacterium]|nr:protein-glutamate O-methyltransferase CheR [Geobacteraceae bacterium]
MQRPILTTSGRAGARGDIPERSYEKIRRILKSMTGLRLDNYKSSCVKRRIAVRMNSVGCETAEQYVEYLLTEKAEAGILAKKLTIHVSKFFRNPSTFTKLKDEVLPELFSRRRLEGNRSVSLVSIGCAAGEEPYTLALILKDCFPEELSRFSVSIHGTDIDRDILRLAEDAVYGPESLDETPPGIRERHFLCKGGKYHLDPRIQEMVSFAHYDLLQPTRKAATDLILCRNVLIYFERSSQDAILSSFAESLREGGFLVLGKTETMMGKARELFLPVCQVERIYRKA